MQVTDAGANESGTSADGAQCAPAAGVCPVSSHAPHERRRSRCPFRKHSWLNKVRNIPLTLPHAQRIQPIPNSIPPPSQPPFRPMGYQPPPQFNAPPPQQQQPPQAMPPFAPTAGRPPPGYAGTPPQHGMPPSGFQQPPQQYQQPPQQQQPPQPMQQPPQQQQPSAVPPPAAQPPVGGANQQAIQAALSMVSEDQRVRSLLSSRLCYMLTLARGRRAC
jgi:hypothetical protein